MAWPLPQIQRSLDRHQSGAVKACAVRRRVIAERWDKHAIARFNATPGNPGGAASDDAPGAPDDQHEDDEPPTEEEEEEEKHRYLRLRKKDFERYGYSDECAGCARMRRGAKPPYRHNQDCRRKLEKGSSRTTESGGRCISSDDPLDSLHAVIQRIHRREKIRTTHPGHRWMIMGFPWSAS